MTTTADRLKSVFDQAAEIAPPADRAGFLDAACGGDSDLRSRVDALLRAHAEAGSFLEHPLAGSTGTAAYEPAGPTVTVLRDPSEAVGAMIGSYKLIEQIGEGGMGSVWMAQQTEPVKRLVAVKLIKAGMDSRQVIARFEAERQALALMDHPNIAKVHDAGTIDRRPLAPREGVPHAEREAYDGRPYFVMELVKGTPITKFCDERKLSPRERLELFIPVCHAIQHAHQKGIIHRDIKPTNVLVALHDEKPVPKVIDFGVAKAVGQQLTEKTLYTGFGALIGTPSYMAPEQASFNQLDVDTRADVYALGVLLYELLAGSPPFEPERMKTVALDEVLRLVREEEPQRPSQRLSTSEAKASIAAVRQSEPARLSKLLRGELDWVVMKALEKDRNRRYETANGFAMDVQRYLTDEPVQACPPTAGYRLRKFARRNKRSLGTLALLSAVVLVAVPALAVSYVRTSWALDGREKALQRETQANKELERTAYIQRIALAGKELAVSNVGRAEQLLDECPEHLRGWEWHFLKRRRFGDLPLLQHNGPLYRTAFSLDGRQIATGAEDGTVVVWDAETGITRYTFPLQGKSLPVGRLAYSPDSRYLAAAIMHSGEVLVWDATRGECLHRWKPHEGQIFDVAFSPDSRQLASAGRDRRIRLWDVTSWDEVGNLPTQEAPVMGVAFHPNGHLLSAGGDGTVKTWDPATGQELSSCPGPVKYVVVARFSPDGRRLAWAIKDGSVKVWDTASGQQFILQGHTNGVRGAAFSPDGQRLATAGFDRTIRIWDMATGQEMLTIDGHLDGVNDLAFSRDGNRLISASYDCTVRIWDATRLIGKPPTAPLLTLPGKNQLRDVAFSPDDQRIAAACQDGTVTVWDAVTGQPDLSIPAHADHARGVAYSPNGQLLASAGWDGTIKLWDPATGQPLRPPLRVGSMALSVTFSPDGRLLAAATEGGAVIWDTTTWEKPVTIKGDTSGVPSLAFDRDGRRLITAGASQRIAQLWDVSDKKVIHTLTGHGSPVNGVALSRDGKFVATASNDKTVKVWDAATGKEIIRTLTGHDGYVWRVAFSPDGRYLASASWDSTVKIWDLTTFKEVCTLRGHAGHVWNVAFSHDGKRLASASGYAGNGEVKVWDAALWDEKLRAER